MGESNVYIYDETNPLEQSQINVLHYHSEPQDTTTYLVQLPDSRPQSAFPYKQQTRRSRTTSILNTHQLPNTIEEEKEPLESYIRKNLSTFRRSLTPEDLEHTSSRHAKEKTNGEDNVISIPVGVQEMHTQEVLSHGTNGQQNHYRIEDIKVVPKTYKHKGSDEILYSHDNAEPPDKKPKRENHIKRPNVRTSFKDEVTVFPLFYDHVSVSHESPFEKEKNESNRRPSSRVKVMIMIDSDEDEDKGQLQKTADSNDESKQVGESAKYTRKKQKVGKNKIKYGSREESGDEETIWQSKDHPKKNSEINEEDLETFDGKKELCSKDVLHESQINEDDKSDESSPKGGKKTSECQMPGHKYSSNDRDSSDRKNKSKPGEEDKGLPDKLKIDHGKAKDDNETKESPDSKQHSRYDSTSYPDKILDGNNKVNIPDKTRKKEPLPYEELTTDEGLSHNDRKKQSDTKEREDSSTVKKRSGSDDDSTANGQQPKPDKSQNTKPSYEKHTEGEQSPRVDGDGRQSKPQSKEKNIEEDGHPKKSSKGDKILRDIEPHKRKSRDGVGRQGSGTHPRYLTLKAPKSKTQMNAIKRYHIQIPEHGRPETGFNVRFNLNDENNVDMSYDGPVKITNYYSSNKYS